MKTDPYIELMTGMFTDNQPDFTFLKPYEEKSFTQYFMPYKQAGALKTPAHRLPSACRRARASCASRCTPPRRLPMRSCRFYAVTRSFSRRILRWTQHSRTVTAAVPDTKHYTVRVLRSGKTLLDYTPCYKQEPVPPLPRKFPHRKSWNDRTAIPRRHPSEQYRHATRDAGDYYREATAPRCHRPAPE